jgi:transposase-like protein
MNCSKVGELSYRDLVEMMAAWFLEFERRWSQFARPVRASWRVDETYVKIRGKYRSTRRLIARAKRGLPS